MKNGTKLVTGMVTMMLLCGSAMADTFYLQSNKERTVTEIDQSIWWDAPTGGSAMLSVGAGFAGNRFELNGNTYSSYNISSEINGNRIFVGTLVKNNETIYAWTKYWVVAGLHVTTNSVTSNNGMLLRVSDGNMTVDDLELDGLLRIRANTDEKNLTLNIGALKGAGTLSFGRDQDEAPSIWGLDIDDSAFAGTLEVYRGNLQFNDNLLLTNATLSVSADDFNGVTLSNNATFATMIYGGIYVEVGAYTAVELNTLLGTTRFSGTGTLTVLADNIKTFYLQGTRTRSSAGGDTDYWENAQQWWWDDPATNSGANMADIVGADFAGNRFELNGYSYNTWSGNSTSVSAKYTFGGTLVKGNETITKWAMPTWELAGLHVTTDSVSAGKGIRFRNSDGAMNVNTVQLDGLLTIQANSTEHNFDLSVANLKGAGELRFGDDDTLLEDGGSTWKLVIDNSSFAGTIRAAVGNLEFANAIVLPNATLLVEASSDFVGVVLSNDVTFAAMNYGETLVADGAYTAAELNTLLGTSRFSGLGTLTVAGPPSLSYAAWLDLYPTLGSKTNMMDDAEVPPDGMNNLLEFALGGNPTSDDAAAVLPVSNVEAGWLYMLYNRRADAATQGLTYTVVTDTDLVLGTMTTEVPAFGVSTVPLQGFVTVTNRISMATDPQAFMQLKVQLD